MTKHATPFSHYIALDTSVHKSLVNLTTTKSSTRKAEGFVVPDETEGLRVCFMYRHAYPSHTEEIRLYCHSRLYLYPGKTKDSSVILSG